MIQDIFILGATGNVGKELVRQIYLNGDTNPQLHANPSRVIGIASSKEFLYSPKGMSYEIATAFSRKDISTPKYSSLDEVLSLVQRKHNDNQSELVFVDVTAEKDHMTDFHLKVMDCTDYGIVTANKNPLSLFDNEVFNRLASKTHRYGYSCSVMAGAGAIQFLQDSRDVNDIPTLIEGCFSGTLGYICSELENGKSLYDAVKKAYDLGYTEPHPRDDLNGLDVARKLLILARTAGYNVNLKNIHVEPFISKKYFKKNNVKNFLESMLNLNGEFNEKIIEARNKGNTLRYVAQMIIENDKPILRVGLKEVAINSSLGTLQGTANRIIIVNNAYPIDNPFDLKSPGAGLTVTAQNIRKNLLHQLKGRQFL